MWDYSNRWTRLVGKADLLETASAGLNRRVRPCGHSDTKGRDMTVNRSFVAAVALTAAIAISAIGANAAPATRTASAFELTLERKWTGWAGWGPAWDLSSSQQATFAAGAPFCRSGTFVELETSVGATGPKYRLTCDDGSGSLLVSASAGLHDPLGPALAVGSWRILEGTGSYVGLRGKGSLRSEILNENLDPDCVASDIVEDPLCPSIVTWRSTLQGIAGEDAVAPTIGFSSVEVTKLRRPAGAYSLKLAIALRDELEGNPVSYTLRVTPATSARELASSVGTTQAGSSR